jgi:hypothetical protein
MLKSKQMLRTRKGLRYSTKETKEEATEILIKFIVNVAVDKQRLISLWQIDVASIILSSETISSGRNFV